MGRERMLLDRIADRGDPRHGRYEPSATEDIGTLMESVRRHLDRLLNARHDMCETVPDYGLPALTDLTIGSGDYVQRVQKAIHEAIKKYEPRLRNVKVGRVEDEEDAHTVSFRIEAKLVGETDEVSVCYETMVTGSGQFEVSE
jgi:type VI secretion system lysozyme-like protein